MTKNKALADDKLYIAKVFGFAFDRVENIAGKGENGGYQHCLPFPECFQNSFSFNDAKSWDCVVKG